MRLSGVEIDDVYATKLRSGKAAELLAVVVAKPADHFLRGLAATVLGRFAEARVEFAACADAFPLPCRIETAYIDIIQRQRLAEALEVLRACSAETGADDGLAARVWHLIGLAEGKSRRSAAAIDALLRTVEAYQTVGDRWGLAQVRDTLGEVEAARGRLDYALQCYALALVDKTLQGDSLGMALTLGNLGRVQLRAGRYHDAVECFERDRALCEELGDVRGKCRMFNDLGRTRMAQHEDDLAEAELRCGIEESRRHGFRDTEFFCRKDLALLQIGQSRLDDAQRELQAARALVPEQGEAYLRLILEAAEGELLAARGDRRAIEVLERTVRGFHEAELPDLEIPARIALAEALLRHKRPAEAERCLLAGLRIARAVGYSRYLHALNDAMTRLDVVDGVVDESDRNVAVDAKSAAPTDYVIRAFLGKGTFGEVHRIFDPQRAIDVALKRLFLSQLYDVRRRNELVASARTELEAAARVRHPGVVRVHAIRNDANGDLCIVQEYIQGGTLRGLMPETNTASPALVVPKLIEIAHALEALHAAGVVHRDLKPENILLRDGRPVLVDFGIACLVRDGARPQNVAGTLAYAAPEQAAGARVDARADLYALGVIAFEWLAGIRPLRLRGETWDEQADDLAKRPAPAVTEFRSDVSPPLVLLINSLLQKKPRRRPASAAEVARLLQELGS